MKEDDFVEMMKEIVPKLIDEAAQAASSTSSSSASGSHGTKREFVPSPDDTSSEPPLSRAKPSVEDDSLLVEAEHECLLVDEVRKSWNEGGVECLMAAHLQKKLSKEIPPSVNDPHLQHLVDKPKALEWETLIEKGAIKIHYGRRAQSIKQQHPDRFIGSCFVIIRKPVIEGKNVDSHDDSNFKVKSRWCLQGHLDPDLDSKAMEGPLQSPTLSQMSRVVLMQILASFKWQLQLGNIKGAFMEAGPLPNKYQPLYAHMPKGGIPGVPFDAVLEVVSNVYEQNDAPHAWYTTFIQETISDDWIRSKFDNCLYYLRDADNKLKGIMGVHVDDTAIGGEGKLFQDAVARLKQRFPYRKWRVMEGEFCVNITPKIPRSSTSVCLRLNSLILCVQL